MTSFRKAKAQAQHAVKLNLEIGKARHTNRNDNKVHSLGTKRNYEQALSRVTSWIKENRFGDLKSLTKEKAIDYLEYRGQSIGQKTLDQERQAIQIILGVKLRVIKSELTEALKCRAYTEEQVKLIINSQNEKNSLATKIAFAAGLRAHELLSLLPKDERAASTHRTWSNQRFLGKEGIIYTVIGKGGLIREVLIPNDLSIELERHRLKNPMAIKDREINYTSYYSIAGGKNWSNSFSAASKRLFNWSHGAHGVRHSFAQNRMNELQRHGLIYNDALGIVSELLGHFRPCITEVYLR